MRLLRHLLAVSLAIAVVVALGFVWSWSGAASIVADGGGERFPGRVQGGNVTVGVRNLDRRGAGGFSLSNVSDLVQTLAILALIITVIVIVDQLPRRYGPRRFPVRGPAPRA